MHKGKALSCVVLLFAALAFTGFDAAPVLAVDQPVGVSDVGCYGVVVMREGDVFVAGFGGSQCGSAQLAWGLLGNVFSSTGRGAGRVVGINQNGQIVAASGDWFWLNCSYSQISFQGNVFDITGIRAPGEEFVTSGSGCPGGGYEYAVTTYGNVFRWSGCVGWEYAGAINVGPTNTKRLSWGKLKSIYR